MLAPLTILFGYVIFGMVGFGATLTNTPLLAPFAALGLVLGNRLHHGLSARRILLFVYVLIIANGAALVVRAW